MIRKVVLILALIIGGIGVIDAKKVSVIPIPLSIEEGTGEFNFKEKLRIHTNLKAKSELIFKELIATPYKIDSFQKSKESKSDLVLKVVDKLKSGLINNEAYELEVSPEQIKITALTEQGLFYGVQTLLQLGEGAQSVQAITIADEPRFGYRGFMLDVSRHFSTKEFVKKQIDALAYFKFNRLHLHLTDAAGWRIEIKQYPRLTEFAAWRPEAIWKKWWNNDRAYCEFDDPKAQGGFYTQEDIKEILDYADSRFITVIPEIEMPGHSEEVLAAYPELSCAGEAYKNADFCAGNDEVFTFLENVLTEVIDLFPSEYIHIGGDEAGKNAWRTCPKCKERMELEGLEDVDQLQSYFIERINKFIKSKGRKLLGWDEIIQGGLAKGATVMSWRGEEGGITAVKSGHEAIMTPGEFCYFDGYQDAPHTQPEAIGGYLPLKKVYSYNPIPAGLTAAEAALIKGVQANLWVEYISTPEHVEMMIYPRLLALSEVAWSSVENKDWVSFHSRALEKVDLLKEWGYNPFELSKEVGNRKEAEQELDHLARGKKVTYNAPFHEAYPADGERSLTDGIRGGWTYGDKRWQGFISRNRLDVVIDLEKVMEFSEVKADIMQSPGAEVYLPSLILIEVSDDGENFTTLYSQEYEVEKGESILIKKYGWSGEAKGRYIRFVARSSKTLGGWIFTDEIVVN